ncbi:MAG: hypothetical protein JRK26_05745 [Deltaproteobacteria bacterium]|nr:hypothetical protein [Deltaproteobacteria bacterium]
MHVKEPPPSEYDLIRENQIVFTYLHMAAAKELTQALHAFRPDLYGGRRGPLLRCQHARRCSQDLHAGAYQRQSAVCG